MWSYDPASAEAQAALAFLKSYGAPDSLLVQHPRPMINPLSTIPSDVENLMLLQLYDMQELYTQNVVTLYAGAVHDWTLNLVEQPHLPMPPIPDLPNLIAPMVELLFGGCGIDAPLVVTCPSLALRLLRRAGVAPGDPNEYVPYPPLPVKPVDNRVIGNEWPSLAGYFQPGPADHFPDHYIYTLDGKSYLKFVNPFGAFWKLLTSPAA